MSVILWSVLAIGLAFIAVLVMSRATRHLAPPIELPPGESLPVTPVERLTRWSLALGLLSVAVMAAIVIVSGPTTFDEEVTSRLAVMGLFVASLLLLAAPFLVAGVWAARDERGLDERDRAVLTRAPASQAPAMIVLLVVWDIALQESFRGEPGIPVTLVGLLVWSCLLAALAAADVGILIGYRRP
jgi:hypothetical protein